MGRANPKAVILGANGTMGPPSAVVFAGGGFDVVMLARDLSRAREALSEARNQAHSEAVAERITPGTYERDLERAARDAALVFDSLAEDLALKREFFAWVDRLRGPECVVASGSSGLSVAEMARGRSGSFRGHFLGIHLFNPPNVIPGAEVIPHPETDPAVVGRVVEMLTRQLGRKVIVARDRPAFVGNRIGFKVLNETAQLAGEHGVAFIDYILGPHTGRAMAPLKTIDLVGWDVHKAIVGNVWANCEDEAHSCFRLPAYMEKGIAEGRLGDKTLKAGGFYRKSGETVKVLDPGTGAYRPFEKPARVPFVERMKHLNRVGRYEESICVLAEATGFEAEMARRVLLGYVSYALNRVGEVAETASDVDTIMLAGFNWAPPSVFVAVLGPKRTIELLGRLRLAVPPVVEQAADRGDKLFKGSVLDYGRTFVG